jgi:NADPH:quinone reductase-like Zn-dependent oxidoreductase
MTIDTGPVFPRRDPELLGQTVAVIGGGAGIGLETARRARSEGAEVILTAADLERLAQPAQRLGAVGTAAVDVTDPDSLERFFESLAAPVDHVMVTGLSDQLMLAAEVARAAAGKVTLAGSLVFAGGATGPTLAADLALELAPVRVNLVAAGPVPPADVAALAVHLMINTAITGTTVDVDGGQRLFARARPV